MSDEIQTRISVGQAFNIEAQRVLNNAKIDGKMISSMVMNAEIKAGILHTYDNIKSIQDSMIVSKQVADDTFKQQQTARASAPVKHTPVQPIIKEQAFEV